MTGMSVEEWPAAHGRLVEEMRAVRPGLTEAQAHAALQALRTLRWVLHREDAPCGPQAAAAAVCGAVDEGWWGEPMECARKPHDDDPWHKDGRGRQWRDDEGSTA